MLVWEITISNGVEKALEILNRHFRSDEIKVSENLIRVEIEVGNGDLRYNRQFAYNLLNKLKEVGINSAHIEAYRVEKLYKYGYNENNRIELEY